MLRHERALQLRRRHDFVGVVDDVRRCTRGVTKAELRARIGVVPLRGLLTEMRIPQEQGTPLYIDSASTVFVAQSRGAVKKSAWIRRRAEVLTEAFDMGECDPRKIEEYNNFSDPETKYLVYRVWMRHLHYTHNLDGEPPPPVIKPSKKGPTTAKVLTAKEKQDFLLLVGL